MDQWYIRAINRLITTTTQAHFCFKTKSIKPKQMLIVSVLTYIYIPMFIICLYKKPQTHFRVCTRTYQAISHAINLWYYNN